MSALLRVRGLVKHFPVRRGFLRRVVGSVRAVDGVDLTVDAGSTVALVGESGCGKTTAGRAILRLIEPSGGTIEVAVGGAAPVDLRTLAPEPLRAMRRHLQIVFQDPYASLNPRQTIAEIVGRPMVLHGLARPADAEDHVRTLLEKVGLPAAYVTRYPHEMSGGQRQRVGIARAIGLRPSFVILDEAVSALDVSVRAQVLNLLADLQEELGLAYLFITHDLSVVRHSADRIAVMYLGRIVEDGPREAVLERPLHPYTQALVSAAPEPDPGKRRKRIVLTGDVPSPLSPPSGCAFHPRCPVFQDPAERARLGLAGRCDAVAPPVREAEGDHRVACHL